MNIECESFLEAFFDGCGTWSCTGYKSLGTIYVLLHCGLSTPKVESPLYENSTKFNARMTNHCLKVAEFFPVFFYCWTKTKI